MDTPTTSTAPRQHRGHPPSNPDLKGSTPARSALWHVIPLLTLVALAMFGGLRLAERYLMNDWSDRVTAARAAGRGNAAAATERPSGRHLRHGKVSPSRWLAHRGPVAAAIAALEGDAAPAEPDGKNNEWLLLARVSRGETSERALLLAEATGCPSERVEWERGRQALLDRRPADALAAYRRALAAKPGWPPALMGEAVAATRLRKRDLALSALAAYLPSDPHNRNPLRLAAYLLCETGRSAEGLALLERELADGGDPALYLDAAQLAARARQPLNAARYLDAALSRNLPLPGIASLYMSPLFDNFRATPEGKDFRHRLAATARARLAAPSNEP